MIMVATESQIDEIDCGHCGAKFTPKRKCKWQRFCSSACRFAHWNEKNPRQRIVAEQLQRIEAKIDALCGVPKRRRKAD